MQHDSRIQKSLLNAKVSLICYGLSICMSFFSRKIFIDQLGADFLGLSSTYSSLLGFLNLAELGVGQAISVVLYKPIFDKDRTKVNEIISVMGFLYHIIGLIILAAGLIVSLFLPQIFPHTKFSPIVIYLGFYSSLFGSLLGYFCNYKQTLLWADQRGYEITGYFQVVGLIKTAVQMALAYYVRSYVLYFSIEIIFSIIYAIVLRWRVKTVYPWMHTYVSEGKSLFKKYSIIGKYTGQLFIHRIGSFVQFQIMPMLIYGFSSLGLVAFYNNYTIITTQVGNLMGTVLNTTSASVGSLVAEADDEKIYKIYKELLCVRYFAAGTLMCCVYYLASDFISAWLGSKYILSNTIVFLICLQSFFNLTRGVNEEYINAYGLFSDIWAPIVEASIFVAVSMSMGHYYGLAGVLLGPVVSLILIVNIWKPYFLFTRGMKRPLRQYWSLIADYIILLGIAFLIACKITDMVGIDGASSWGNWILKSTIFASVDFIVSFLLFYFLGFGMKDFFIQLLSARHLHGNK